MMTDNFLPNSSRLTWSGVRFSDAVLISLAILPTSVSIPIAVTTQVPLP